MRVVATVEHAGGRTRIVENPQGLVLAAAGVDAFERCRWRGAAAYRWIPTLRRGRSHQRCAPRPECGSASCLSNTLGRAWRAGQIDQAIGAAGVGVVDDLRGSSDSGGRVLEATIAALGGNEIASAAELVKGKTSGIPVAVVRGLGHLVTESLDEPGARSLQSPSSEDLFRLGAAEAWREGYLAALRYQPGAAARRGLDGHRAGQGRVWEGRWRYLALTGHSSRWRSRSTRSNDMRTSVVSRVIVVTSDPAIRAEVAGEERLDVVPDPGSGLTAAIEAGSPHPAEPERYCSGTCPGSRRTSWSRRS